MSSRVIPERDVIKNVREEIEKKTGKTPEQLYEEREKRLRDATELREPDRVPVCAGVGGYFALKYVGSPLSVEFYEPSVYRQASIRALLDFEPDTGGDSFGGRSGLAMELLGSKYVQWPGGVLSPNIPWQVLDREIMKEDEYELFLADPTDFMLRYYLPRSFRELEPLSKLPTLGLSLGNSISGIITMSPIFAEPELQKLAQILLKAGREQAKFGRGWGGGNDLGFPPYQYTSGVNPIPFDWVGDFLRGMNGVMTDVFKRPTKLLAACEKVLELMLFKDSQTMRSISAEPTKRGRTRRIRGGTPHLTSDRFLSRKQFERFVWPTWKKMLLAQIDQGFAPCIHLEGKNDDRLEYFLELPKGKFLLKFEQADMFKMKEMFGNHCCILGNLPFGLLELGSPQEVEERCKTLIEVCGKGGGYILDSGQAGENEAKPANVKAMIESAKKYGRY